MKQRAIAILGSTGSIGVNSLKLVDQFPKHFRVETLAAGQNIRLLAQQVNKYRPRLVSIRNAADIPKLEAMLAKDLGLEIHSGDEGAEKAASLPTVDVVVSAIVGFAGVRPTLAAIDADKLVALANKESIVAAGDLIMQRVKTTESMLIPVDSEHSAIFQTMHGRLHDEVAKLQHIILTASGGPFLHVDAQELQKVTPQEALQHPTWQMGAKITIDSATMMNKGLEVIEATRLFNIPADKVKVQIHPQSIIHSLIEYVDGSMLAQLGITDMRGPLVYAMAYPDRLHRALPSLSLSEVGNLSFFDPDFNKFPCLRLAYEAANVGQSMPTVLNAANEICVAAFLKKEISFPDIARYIEKVLEQHQVAKLHSLDQVCTTDAWAREQTKKLIQEEL